MAIAEQSARAVTVSRWLKRTAAQTRTGIIQNAHLKIERERNQLSKINPLPKITVKKRAAASAFRFQLAVKIFEGTLKDFVHIKIKGVTRRIPETSPSHQVDQTVKYSIWV